MIISVLNAFDYNRDVISLALASCSPSKKIINDDQISIIEELLWYKEPHRVLIGEISFFLEKSLAYYTSYSFAVFCGL